MNAETWSPTQDGCSSKPYNNTSAVHRRTLARSLTLPTVQVAEDFALPAVTASNSLQFTTPLLAAEQFGCWPSGVELPATEGYVCTVSDDLLHSTKDVPVY